jgi:hypothetical protein
MALVLESIGIIELGSARVKKAGIPRVAYRKAFENKELVG